MNPVNSNDIDPGLRERAFKLGLLGLIANWESFAETDWLPKLIKYEEEERKKRSLDRRIKAARLGTFKPLADYDWAWPKKLERAAIDELFKLSCFTEGTNAILLGPNGVGKTMLIKNLAHHAVMRGYTTRFITASAMLNELACQESTAALNRRLKQYTRPQLLCIDEVGYLSYDSRYADLLFEVVTQRYETRKPIVLTTNKPFSEWPQVFPHAACVVTLVDRLIHRCEVIAIEGDSYRKKEAQERAASRRKSRLANSNKNSSSSSTTTRVSLT